MAMFHLLKIRTSIDIFKNEKCKVTFGLEYIFSSGMQDYYFLVLSPFTSSYLDSTFSDNSCKISSACLWYSISASTNDCNWAICSTCNKKQTKLFNYFITTRVVAKY